MRWSGEDLPSLFDLREKLGEGALPCPPGSAVARSADCCACWCRCRARVGAFGAVYRAVHRTAGFELAIKMVRTRARPAQPSAQLTDCLVLCFLSCVSCA